MSEDGYSQYSDANRAFLQAFLARSTLTFKEAKPILAAIFTAHEDRATLTEDVTESDFNSFVIAANSALSPFDLEIRSTFPQDTSPSRARIYALVNTTSDPIMQLSTTHSADEISFVKRLLDAMFETYNTPRQEIMAITSMQAVRLHKAPAAGAQGRGETQGGSTTQGSSGAGLTMSQAEKTIKSLVEEGWLEKSRAGFYSLSPRALMELRAWLYETYNDLGGDDEDDDEEEPRVDKIKVCWACKEIVTVGQRCSNRTCPCRIHDFCATNFFRAQRNEKCPICKKEWSGNDFVGERAVTTTEKWLQGRRRSGGGGGASTGERRSTQSRVEVEEEEEGEEAEEEDEEGGAEEEEEEEE
ncbi:MAG: hypothetical protein M1819_001716 [Sarea resinae]|nr:MAG: hypothetical protein M1819_001716 [Sarea resinae]